MIMKKYIVRTRICGNIHNDLVLATLHFDACSDITIDPAFIERQTGFVEQV